ncbi:MAG: HAMP domain-containing sensor histidine kinase [Chloroflexota bacterium]
MASKPQSNTQVSGDGVEALLARTRRQVSRFTLVAIVVVVSIVGVGGALAGSNALDAGLDRALVSRAEKIMHELQEVMPPLPSPVPGDSPTPSTTGHPEESGAPGSTEPGESAEPSQEPSEEPSGDPTLPPGGGDDEDGGDGGSDDGRLLISARLVALVSTPAAAVLQDDPPIIPPGIDSAEFGAGGPWAILGPDGTTLASSLLGSSEFPVLAPIIAAPLVADVRTALIGQIEYRVMTLPVRHPQLPNGGVLAYVQVAGRLDVRDAQRQNLFGSLIILGLVALGAALLLSLFITRRVLAPISAAASRERAMVAKASHELRTPASVILSSAEILEREGLIKPAGRDLLRGIAEESQRLGRLSADLLTLSRGTSGAKGNAPDDLKLEPMDAAELVRRAVDRTTPMASKAGLSVAMDLGDQSLNIRGDADRLLQLLLNLVENAIRHSPPEGTITIGGRGTSSSVQLWVDDEGLGIPAEEREVVFDAFYRSPESRSMNSEGSGLGLAIARAIAIGHGGSLQVLDAPSGGARLQLELPKRTGR